MARCAHRSLLTFLLLVTFNSPLVYSLEEEAPLAAEQQEPDGDTGLSDEEQKTLDDFFAELDEIASQTNELSRLVAKLQEQIGQKFRHNEQLLSQLTPEAAAAEANRQELRERQIILAQQYAELDRRKNLHQHLGARHEVVRKLQKRFSEFQKNHPRLANAGDVHRRFSEITHKVLSRDFIHGHNEGLRLSDALNQLSTSHWERDEIPRLSVAHPAEQDGYLQRLRPQIQDLLKLQWNGNRLQLDRSHWSRAFAGKTITDVRSLVDELLKKEGYHDEDDKKDPINQVFERRQSQPNVVRLFQELRLGQSRSTSWGGDETNFDTSLADGELRARMRKKEQEFELRLEENSPPYRLFRLTDDGSSLTILLIGDSVCRFAQRADGTLQCTEVVGDDVVTHRSTSFAELYRTQPRFVEERFFALLDHLGILPPMTRFDDEVVGRVLDRLSAETDAIEAEVGALANQLDSRRFAEREAAFKQLNENLDRFYEALYRKCEDEHLSAEARSRIRLLLKNSECRESAGADRVIAALELTSDADYLEQLRDVVDQDQHPMIDKRLATLKTRDR